MTPNLDDLATLFRRVDIVNALVDVRTATHAAALEAARASLRIEALGDRWAAELLHLGDAPQAR